MSYLVIHADRAATALADDPVVPAAELRSVQGAIELFAEAGRVRAEAAAVAELGREQARAEGHAAGYADGLAAGQAEVRAELFRMALRDTEAQRRRQGEIATLALEVVRRIAGAIGDEALVTALADRAAAALVPDTVATVKVAPAHLFAVAERLTGRAGLSVEGDAAIAPTDCVVETALGRTHAGLDTQLAQIEAAWRQAAS